MVMKLTGFKVNIPWLQPLDKSPASVFPDNSLLISPSKGERITLLGSVFPKTRRFLIGPLLDAFGGGSDVNYRQTFCFLQWVRTKGSVGLLTALLVIR
jgi:hypothetical protein